MTIKNLKEAVNPQTGEKVVSIYSTSGNEFVMLRLQKGIEIKEIKPQREKENQAHFIIRMEEKQ